MGTHRLHRRATALVLLALLGPTACSARERAPVLQSTVTREATDDDDASVDEPLTFIAPDRSSNEALGLSADGPERTDVHGTYRQAAIADDSPLFEYSPDVVGADVESVFSPEQIAEAQRTAVTFFVREYIDSEMVADDTDATRAVVAERLRSEFAAGDFWDSELSPALATHDCTYLVDCRSNSRDPSLGRTLAEGSDLRFTLEDLETAEIFLSDESSIGVRLTARYDRSLDMPDQEHAFETTAADATYALVTDGSAWFLDGFEVLIDSMDVGALVDGGSEVLPVLDDVDWGNVPSGFTPRTFEGVEYALGPEWEPGGEDAWEWLEAAGGDEVVLESFVGPVLESSGERAGLAVVLMPKTSRNDLSETPWVLPLDGGSYNLEIPGAAWTNGEFMPVSYDERDEVDVWVETDDAYVWFITFSARGEGETALREIVQTITVP